MYYFVQINDKNTFFCTKYDNNCRRVIIHHPQCQLQACGFVGEYFQVVNLLRWLEAQAVTGYPLMTGVELPF